MTTIELVDFSVALPPDRSRRLSGSVSLKAGDACLLLGSNGSGKTTLLDIFCGIRRCDAGRLIVERPELPIAYAVQDSSSGLLQWMSAIDNILLPSRISQAEQPEIEVSAVRLLSLFRLQARANDFPYHLSGGERQVVNLIRALSTPAQVMLLDEPLAQLHQDFRTLARREIARAMPTRASIFVSHDRDDLELPFSRFLYIESGVVREIDRPYAERIVINGL